MPLVEFWDNVASAREDLGPATRWDYVEIGGWILLGQSSVSVKTGRRMDRRDVPGGNVVHTFMGYAPAEIEIRHQMWTDTHLDDFARFLEEVQPRKEQGEKPPTTEIRHPATQIHNIGAVYITEISGPHQRSPGVFEVVIKATEFFPETRRKSANVEPLASPQRIKSGNQSVKGAKAMAEDEDPSKDPEAVGT